MRTELQAARIAAEVTPERCRASLRSVELQGREGESRPSAAERPSGQEKGACDMRTPC